MKNKQIMPKSFDFHTFGKGGVVLRYLCEDSMLYEGTMATLVTFFSGGKLNFGEIWVNVGVYKVKPHIFQKFSFFLTFSLEKNMKKVSRAPS